MSPRARTAALGARADTGVDGRTARRDRNRLAVLDAVLELFSEGDLDPSPPDVARRSGVSLRSVYRYVADADELLRAAIDRHLERVGPLFAIEALGSGPLDARIEAFVTTRMRVYEAIAATARAARLRAASNDIIRDQLEAGRRRQRAQLEAQFAPELAAVDARHRRAMVAAADALTQIETIDHFRVHRRFSVRATHEALTEAIARLLAPPTRARQ